LLQKNYSKAFYSIKFLKKCPELVDHYIPLPTLSLSRYRTKPKAKYEMRSVALFRWHFQPLAVVHFHGALEHGLHLIESTRRLALKNTELATAQCETIRLRLYKIGAIILRNTRRIRFLLSSNYPKQLLFLNIAEKLCPA
jgi:hypothetical protein